MRVEKIRLAVIIMGIAASAVAAYVLLAPGGPVKRFSR